MLVYPLVSASCQRERYQHASDRKRSPHHQARHPARQASDGGGLQLSISPDGAKRWRLAYRFGGSQKLLAIGVYPAVRLRDARDAQDAAKRLLASGQDPSLTEEARQGRKSEGVRQYVRCHRRRGLGEEASRRESGRTIVKIRVVMRLACPALGARPIAEISAPEMFRLSSDPSRRTGGMKRAKKLRGAIGEVLRFAIATGRAETDPTGALKGALVSADRSASCRHYRAQGVRRPSPRRQGL